MTEKTGPVGKWVHLSWEKACNSKSGGGQKGEVFIYTDTEM